MKRFIIGDIHGNYNGLMQAINRSGFIIGEDLIYCVGDYIDGHHLDSFKVVDYIIKLKKNKSFRGVIGNHDVWFKKWLNTDDNNKKNVEHELWIKQGGKETLQSYKQKKQVPQSHIDFFNDLPIYIITEQNELIIHGGIPYKVYKHSTNNNKDLKSSLLYYIHDKEVITDMFLNRSMFYTIRNRNRIETMNEKQLKWKQKIINKMKNHEFKMIYIGHTEIGGDYKPYVDEEFKLINIDTAGGSYGKITIMNMDTLEYFQSDISNLKKDNIIEDMILYQLLKENNFKF